MRPIWMILLLAAWAGWAGAQQSADEQERDHERQDRRYYERYLDRTQQAGDDPRDVRDREAFVARADELIRDRNHRVAQTEHYRVQTDDPRLDTQAIATLLEAFRRHFDGFWVEDLELRPYSDPSRVFLFYSFSKYNRLLQADFRFSTQRPKGHYTADLDLISAHTDADTPGGLADTLVHEAAHQLIDQRLYGEGRRPSLWVSEGLASYFGYTRADAEGRFEAGSVGGKGAALFKDGSRRGSGLEARERLRDLKRELKKSQGDDRVHWLLATDDAGRFYGSEASFHYGASWVLVHYLLHGDEGGHRQAFLRFLEADKLGEGTPERLYRELGLERDGVEAAVRDHARKMKAR